jgi:c(7)-type cytochrome triheme protein
MKIKALMIILVIALVGVSIAFAQSIGVRKRAKRPNEYGNVVMNNYSERNNIAPVVFNHWLHRALYTCRLCHVDLGFGMVAGSTEATEEDNKNGIYCGACHDGKEAFGFTEVDSAGNEIKNCYLCHSYGKKVTFKENFFKYTKNFPRARYGDKINWLETEESGLIKLNDFLEGQSIPGQSLKQSKDIEIKSKMFGMDDIIFSHKKHTLWNGCELCHPDIFGVKKGSVIYTMQEIFDGMFCGSCHGIVAFPNTDCRLCHTKIGY